MKKHTQPATPTNAPANPQPEKTAQAAPGAPFTLTLDPNQPEPLSAAPARSQTQQVKCKVETCTNMIWVRRGKRQDYCSATCRAQATLDQPIPEGACEGCRKPMPVEKQGKRYCSNSCRARASERRAGETLSSVSVAGWQKAFETSRRENDALILASKAQAETVRLLTENNRLLAEKLAAKGG